MVILIILLVVVALVAAISIKINIVLYKRHEQYELHYNSMSEFFDTFRNKISEHYLFFDKTCKTNLLMNDPIVVEIIRRLKDVRKAFGDYLKSIEGK